MKVALLWRWGRREKKRFEKNTETKSNTDKLKTVAGWFAPPAMNMEEDIYNKNLTKIQTELPDVECKKCVGI